MRKHSAGGEEAEVDLTPMLDVTFIMLIFFIVTTSFTKESGLEIQRPSGKNAPTQTTKQKANVLVTINGNDQVVIEKREVDVRSVRAFVEKSLAENGDVSVILQAHNSSSTDTLVAVVNAIKEAGVDKVSVGTYDKDR